MTSNVRRIEQSVDHQWTSTSDFWLDHINEAEEESRSHFWHGDPQHLITRSQIHPGSFSIGNGPSIYTSTILPALATAEQEIIFVTCFWARSECLTQLGDTLIKLSQKFSRRTKDTPNLRVRLCFSSHSLFQKLLHTSSPEGHIYPPATWVSHLGLPPPEALDGLDLQIKSLFFLPFSVMHPKFVIIDRKRALMPSCNLSYESWLEGCLPLTGPVVGELVRFWEDTWDKGIGREPSPSMDAASNEHVDETTEMLATSHVITLLPSPHHRSPRFRPFITIPKPPVTPLNAYLENAVAMAQTSIKILTPNLTCKPVLLWLLAALARRVDVTIITNRRMMVLEQLLTAGTITEVCVWSLKRRYQKMIKARDSVESDLEHGRGGRRGRLSIGYFRSSPQYAKSHLKCTVFDEKVVVLGSGNLDRASWYTSQELGVAVDGENVAHKVWGTVMKELGMETMGCVEWI